MRQLISVVTEASVLYLIDEGDGDTTQIAQVINRGLGIADVVRLGVQLESVLALNGRAVNGRAVRHATPALPPASDAEADAQARRIASGSGTRPKPTAKWETVCWCPIAGCDYTGKRSNISTHLKSKKHGYSRDAAALTAGSARPVDDARPRKAAPRGQAGARHIAGVVMPAVAAWAAEHGTVDARQVADHFRMDPSRARKVLHRLTDAGALRDVTPDTKRANQPRLYEAVPGWSS